MQFGVLLFPTASSIAPGELAHELEARGYDSVWFPDHTHIPAARTTPWPGGAELPKEYWQLLDPFVACTAAVVATERLLIGTGICLVVERDPITTAKAVASVDVLSGGRFQFGVGGGWNVEEMANHGTDATTRWRLLAERVGAMRAIWTEPAAQFHGHFVDFDPIWSEPKPFQRPHPPVLVGGSGPHTIDRVLDFGDGWIPMFSRLRRSVADEMADLVARSAARGRSPVPVSMFAAPTDPALLEAVAAAGVTRAVFGVASGPRDDVLRSLDRLDALVASLAGT